jgi:ABC-type Fe3+/spermidine/putrescine transport system ATPase subunit
MAKDLNLTGIHVTHDQSEAMAISDRIAVMKKGKILQVGSPKELYMKPESIFVAHFIGESNFIEGYVSSTNKGNVVVEIREGLKIHASNGNFEEGKQAVLSVRPETLTVEKSVKKASNTVKGKVERITFEGPSMRYEIRLENDALIVAIKSSMSGDWFNIGDHVSVVFPVENTHVFPYPEDRSLKDEIAG